ncbi:hypothetical protein BZA77DRAFT_54826 [Pyronema omphalodes]|nr:hypothetical protein BZA77DRAFT_54826 [Pyronema omphalodes]
MTNLVMDPVGISIGIPGLIALLVGTALRGYKIFETAKALGEDFTELQRQFRVQGERLKDWAYVTNQQANGLDSENTIADFLKQHPEKLELVASTLARVAKVFADMQQMESAYGILIIEPENLIESASDQNKISRFRRMKEKTRKVFFRPKDVTSPDPVFSSPNIASVLQENLPLIELEKRAAEFSRSVSV